MARDFTVKLQSLLSRQWNYGEEGNLQVYNQSEPPEYDLASVDVPIAIYYGDQGRDSIENSFGLEFFY